MVEVERRAQAESGRPLPPPGPPQLQEMHKGSVVEIFDGQYRIRTIMLMLFNFFQTAEFYGFFGWTPTLLIAEGIHITQSLEYTFTINFAALAFPFLNMLFADRVKRKWQVCLSRLAIAAFGILFGQQS
jgi:MFS transporter, putative metabolite:H+ symporter